MRFEAVGTSSTSRGALTAVSSGSVRVTVRFFLRQKRDVPGACTVVLSRPSRDEPLETPHSLRTLCINVCMRLICNASSNTSSVSTLVPTADAHTSCSSRTCVRWSECAQGDPSTHPSTDPSGGQSGGAAGGSDALLSAEALASMIRMASVRGGTTPRFWVAPAADSGQP